MIAVLRAHGISENIIDAFTAIDRKEFIPLALKDQAYENKNIPLAANAYTSKPSTLATLLTFIHPQPNHKVLEIGSGSGFLLALISHITQGNSFGIELLPSLAFSSQTVLKKNPKAAIIHKNGIPGLKNKNPYDRIIVSGSVKEIPTHLLRQLNTNGQLIINSNGKLLKIQKTLFSKKIVAQLEGFYFPPLQIQPIHSNLSYLV